MLPEKLEISQLPKMLPCSCDKNLFQYLLYSERNTMTSLSRCFLSDKNHFQSRDPTVQSMLACLKTARDKVVRFHVVGIPIVSILGKENVSSLLTTLAYAFSSQRANPLMEYESTQKGFGLEPF